MKKFTLKSSYYIDENQVINLNLRPDDPEIEDYIASNFTLENKSDIDTQIAQLVSEMTVILYDKFKSMTHLPEWLRNQYTL